MLSTFLVPHGVRTLFLLYSKHPAKGNKGTCTFRPSTLAKLSNKAKRSKVKQISKARNKNQIKEKSKSNARQSKAKQNKTESTSSPRADLASCVRGEGRFSRGEAGFPEGRQVFRRGTHYQRVTDRQNNNGSPPRHCHGRQKHEFFRCTLPQTWLSWATKQNKKTDMMCMVKA